MDYLRRIRCHYCGDRSQYTKASKVREFHCSGCDAWNYFDKYGQPKDAPARIVASSGASSQRFRTFTSPPPEAFQHSDNSPFCTTCEHNQRIYLETMSNYLPDEDDPRYKEYERALPKFKADLEKRYPQICRKCASKAQAKINRADYYAGTDNVQRISKIKRQGAGLTRQRDDWQKRLMRTIYRLLNLLVYASLFVQAAWHAYGILLGAGFLRTANGDHYTRSVDSNFLHGVLPISCIRQGFMLLVSRQCHLEMASSVMWALRLSTALIWYNPGRIAWYHHTYRMSAVTGQMQYFYMQMILLAVRILALVKLTNYEVVQSLTKQQFLGSHIFVLVFMFAVQFLANRTVQATIYRHNFRITPKPDEFDIFATSAGPEQEHHTPHASSIHPKQLFGREDYRPFPIHNLAPKRSAGKYPSPPSSHSDDENGDAMEIDWCGPQDCDASPVSAKPTSRYFPRSTANHGTAQPSGWGALRQETFRLQGESQSLLESKVQEQETARLRYQPPVEQTPFRGRLPQAPMSMERRLRNPVSQLQFKKAPITQQKDFMKQMRDGIDNSKIFAASETLNIRPAEVVHDAPETGPAISSAISRTKGNLDLRKSSWNLPGDGEAATGLEDLFGGTSFRIADGPAVNLDTEQGNHSRKMSMLTLTLGVMLPLLVAILSWFYLPARRAVCLWLAGRLEDFGIA